MASFLLRSPRIQHELAMLIGLQDILTGTAMPGQLTVTVINFSRWGACLILPTLTLGERHVFYDTLNSDAFALLLYPGQKGAEGELSPIAARSIWMNSYPGRQQPAFIIGIQFLHDQKRLYKLLKKRQ